MIRPSRSPLLLTLLGLLCGPAACSRAADGGAPAQTAGHATGQAARQGHGQAPGETGGQGYGETRGEAIDVKGIIRPYALLPVAMLPHGEVTRRLGGHRLELHTEWQITPPPREGYDTAKVALTEDALAEVDKAGNLHLLHNNDHGYGTEAVAAGRALFMKMRYGPYIRRKADPDGVARLEAAALGNSGALVEALGGFIEVSDATQVNVAGHPAIKMTLSKRAEPMPEWPKAAESLPSPAQRWRAATAVEALSGVAVVDSEHGTLLGLRLSASFVAPRQRPPSEIKPEASKLVPEASALDQKPEEDTGKPEGLVRIDVTHRMSVGLGEDLSVTAPAEFIDEPARPRPMLDRQELLDGLQEGLASSSASRPASRGGRKP